jgi:hypothetical protein
VTDDTAPGTSSPGALDRRPWFSLRNLPAGPGSRLTGILRQFGRSRAAAFILYFVLFWIAAAAAHSGFIGKWGLRDKSHLGFSIQEVLDGTAIQPVIYRQLVPLIVNFAESNTPGLIKNYIKSIASKPAKSSYAFPPQPIRITASGISSFIT